jgi:hypothetical protein
MMHPRHVLNVADMRKESVAPIGSQTPVNLLLDLTRPFKQS